MHPQPIFKIGSLGVYPYGLCMAAGIILCFVFLLLTMKYKKFNGESIDKILIIGVFGTGFGIFAALLFQSVYNYIANPAQDFSLGGMTFIGGLIGGVVSFLAVYFLYIYVVAPRTKIKVLQNHMNATLTDALPFIPIGICIAHAFGRLGCFFGGCCYGMPADQIPALSWSGIACAAPNGYTLSTLVIPTQLFEMGFLFILAGVMALLYFRFKFNYNFGLYAIAYGIWRFLIEYIRDDARGELFPGAALYPSQIWSIVMVVLGIGFFFLQKYVLAKHMKHPERAQAAVTENGAALAVAGAGEGNEVSDAQNINQIDNDGGNDIAERPDGNEKNEQ